MATLISTVDGFISQNSSVKRKILRFYHHAIEPLTLLQKSTCNLVQKIYEIVGFEATTLAQYKSTT